MNLQKASVAGVAIIGLIFAWCQNDLKLDGFRKRRRLVNSTQHPQLIEELLDL